MSLAFALVAAINGSTGSRATLSCGLLGPSLVGVSPATPRFSWLRGGGASRQSHCPVNPLVRGCVRAGSFVPVLLWR
jgi:hypothetical protein